MKWINNTWLGSTWSCDVYLVQVYRAACPKCVRANKIVPIIDFLRGSLFGFVRFCFLKLLPSGYFIYWFTFFPNHSIASNQLIALNDLSVDEIKTAILTKTFWRSCSRARIFVHLFAPGSGPRGSPDIVHVSSEMIRARLELQVEPIWKMPVKRVPG